MLPYVTLGNLTLKNSHTFTFVYSVYFGSSQSKNNDIIGAVDKSKSN